MAKYEMYSAYLDVAVFSIFEKVVLSRRASGKLKVSPNADFLVGNALRRHRSVCMMSQIKPSTSRSNSTGGMAPRNLLNYPMEPIGTRPSTVGEVITLVREGTEEIKQLIEFECDLRFNCKVCGSILPSARSFVIHKRQFCSTKFIDYQRKNVAMMERMSSIVSYESKSLQTNITRMDPLDILNPTNASLLVPLTIGPSQCNGHSHNNPPEPPEELQLRDIEDQSEDDQEPEVPSDVEVIQPARPPADGLYRFGMGGINLLAAKKKKYRTNSMAPPKKRKPKTVLFGFGDEGGGRRVRGDGGEGVSEEGESSMERGNQDEGVRRTVVERFVGINQGRESPMKRSRRIAGVNHDAMDASSTTDSFPTDRDVRLSAEQTERLKDIKDPNFVRRLLDQLAEVADYSNKTCRECRRVVVSIYNLDRHVATQHLGLRETEYSLISKELRRLRSEIFGTARPEDVSQQTERVGKRMEEDDREAPSDGEQPSQLHSTHFDQPTNLTLPRNSRQDSLDSSEDDNIMKPPLPNGNISASPKTSFQDSDSITERLSAIIRNPNTLKEILTTKDKDLPHVDYQLDDLVDIQRQILDAADPYLQCCRICNKQYFDVYVLNRHVMTVHLRLPERSCGTINKLIKEQMKRFPEAFITDPRNGFPLDVAAAPPLPVGGDSGGSE